jgi:hypothetical protein
MIIELGKVTAETKQGGPVLQPDSSMIFGDHS